MKLVFQLLVIFLPVQTQLIKQLFRSRNFLSTPSNLIKMGICLSVSNVSHIIEHKKYLKRIKPFLHQHHQYHHFNYHNFHDTQCIIVSYRDSSPHKQTAWQPGIKYLDFNIEKSWFQQYLLTKIFQRNNNRPGWNTVMLRKNLWSTRLDFPVTAEKTKLNFLQN